MDYSRALSIWNAIYIAALTTTVIATLFLTYFSRRLNSDANQRIAEVELQSARLRNENSQLQLEIERERIQRLRLEEAVAPRRLDEDQRHAISEFLSDHPSESIDMYVSIGTDDGVPFAQDIATAFQSGGWTIDSTGQLVGFGNAARGVSVVVTDWGTAPHRAEVAAQALEHGGLEVNRLSDADSPGDRVRIVVSPKR